METRGKRVALVTGGARRVGRAIVQRLSNAGFTVAFTYHQSRADARQLADQTGALPIEADLSDAATGVDGVVAALQTLAQRLDLLVNNASIYQPTPTGTDLMHARRMMAIHFEAPLLLTRALAPQLRATRGHVVNMLDLLAERPWPAYLAYGASKAALWNLTLAQARELAPEVTVNGIAPGVVAWPDDFPEADRQKYLARVPLGRAGTPQDVANLVHFLATEGPYITGQIIRLDGGRSIM
jgi:pteridine reductase